MFGFCHNYTCFSTFGHFKMIPFTIMVFSDEYPVVHPKNCFPKIYFKWWKTIFLDNVVVFNTIFYNCIPLFKIWCFNELNRNSDVSLQICVSITSLWITIACCYKCQFICINSYIVIFKRNQYLTFLVYGTYFITYRRCYNFIATVILKTIRIRCHDSPIISHICI